MRYVSTSGGWAIGPLEGPTIDIFPPPGAPPLNHTEIPSALDRPLSWSFISYTERRLNPFLRSRQGMVGSHARLIVRFSYPHGMDPLDALYTIEEHEQRLGSSLPAILIGQILGALRGLHRRLPSEHITQIAYILGKTCETVPGTGPSRRLSHRDIEALAQKALGYLLSVPTEDRHEFVPATPVNRARFWLTFAQRLWRPYVLKRLASHPPNDEARWQEFHGLAQIAGLHLYLSGKDHVVVEGISIPTADPPFAWLQVVEWTAGEIPPAALQRFAPSGIRPLWPDISLSRKSRDKELTARALAIAEAFLEEANRRGRFAPTGFFYLSLPPQVPLARWGVTGLRVWASPSGLWVQALGEGETAGPVFEWTPTTLPRAIVLSPHVLPLVHATLAALWHDLRVAREKAFPARQRKTHGPERKKERKERARSTRLPRTVYTLSGRRTWGREEDHVVMRRAHTVREHLRRLPPNRHPSEEARRRARAFGYILPQGYTFVRPHVRGQGREAEAKEASSRVAEQPITAQGLVTLVALLGGEE